MTRLLQSLPASLLALALLAAGLDLSAQPLASGEPRPSASGQLTRFVALGDLPYGDDAKAGERYRALIRKINQLKPSFSVHVGDFKSGSTLCSDEEFQRQLQHFQSFDQPLIYTPGDNEWTDCHRANNGSYDPRERLDTIRRQFFAQPTKSLGRRPITVQSHARLIPQDALYVENQRWQQDGLLFVTVHIVGSNNGFEARDPEAVKEYFARDAANVRWLNNSFDLAESAAVRGVVVFFQADVFDSKSIFETFPSQSGFRQSVGETLLPRAKALGKPVLVVHGDSHQYKVNQPFELKGERIANVFRLEVPGARDTQAVEVRVSNDPVKPFSFSLINP